jgi:cell wall-associated NlpC family hydrolase
MDWEVRSSLKKSLSLASALLLAALVYTPSFAGQTITLTLDEPQLSSSGQSTPTRQPAPSSHTDSVSQPGTVNHKSGDAATIGRIGVVSSDKLSIYHSRSSSRVLATCGQGTPLGIVGEHGDWYGVLMIDMSTGWVRKNSVKLLDYDLVANKRSLPPGGSVSSGGGQIVQSAMKYVGVPYVWGGNTCSGIDCSGFVKAVYSEYGICLPRVARDQANVGYAVTWDDLQPGDRLYFACKGVQVDHAGIYMGNGYFIHSSSRRGGVAVDSLTSGLFSRALVAARRSG